MADNKKKNSAGAIIKDAVNDAVVDMAKRMTDLQLQAVDTKATIDAVSAAVDGDTNPGEEEPEEPEEEIDPALFEELDKSEEDIDEEEQRQAYIKYIEVGKKIDAQMKVINDLEDEIWSIQMKPCLTQLDCKEIQRLRDLLFDESNRLESMKFRAEELMSGEYGICLCCYDLALPEPPEDDFVPKKSKPKRNKTADEICDANGQDTDSDPCDSKPNCDSDLDSDSFSDCYSTHSDSYSEECLKMKIKGAETALIGKCLAWITSSWESSLDI